MGLRERLRRVWPAPLAITKGETTTMGARRSHSARPWRAIGLAAGVGGGLLALVLLTVWLLGRGDTGKPGNSQVIAGIPLPAPPSGDNLAHAGSPSPEVTPDPAAAAVARPGLGLSVPATAEDAFDAVPPVAIVEPLADAPVAALLEVVEGQTLPRTGSDGRQAWQVYARPFDRKDERPRVALIIGGLGLSRTATEAAIARLPGAITLAFDAYADDAAAWTRSARRYGHETLVSLPLQAGDFPFRDLGPRTLQLTAGAAANLRRLNEILALAPGAVGVLAIGGSEFNRSIAAASPILKAIKARGLMLADTTSLAGGTSLLPLAAKLNVPRLDVDVMLDDVLDAAAIDGRLQRLEQLARQRSVAVGLGQPLPLTFARIQAWAETSTAAGIVLAPATAIVDRQQASR